MRKAIRALSITMISALAMMAVTATAAQAGEAELSVEGAALAEGLEKGLIGAGGKGNLLVSPLGLNVECQSSSFENATGGNLTPIGGLRHFHALALIVFHVCKVVGNALCKIYPTATDRTNKTNEGLIDVHVLALATKLNTNYYLKITPPSGSLFTKLFLTVGGGCTLPSENEITGSAGLKVDTPTTRAKSHELLTISTAEEANLGVALKYGSESAIIENSAGPLELATGEEFSFT